MPVTTTMTFTKPKSSPVMALFERTQVLKEIENKLDNAANGRKFGPLIGGLGIAIDAFVGRYIPSIPVNNRSGAYLFMTVGTVLVTAGGYLLARASNSDKKTKRLVRQLAHQIGDPVSVRANDMKPESY